MTGSWEEKLRGLFRVQEDRRLVRFCFDFADIRKKSMLDSDVPLGWWKVGVEHSYLVKENSIQKIEKDLRLREDDFSEQFESVPINISRSC